MVMHKYPPAKDNPGRVSEGTARDMAKRAEIHHSNITQEDVISYLRAMPSREEAQLERNERKRKRRERAGKK